MLGWQESTLKIHTLELYDEFDNLVTVSLYKVMTSKVHCGNLVAMFVQPCDNLATVSKYKVMPRL